MYGINIDTDVITSFNGCIMCTCLMFVQKICVKIITSISVRELTFADTRVGGKG